MTFHFYPNRINTTKLFKNFDYFLMTIAEGISNLHTILYKYMGGIYKSQSYSNNYLREIYLSYLKFIFSSSFLFHCI